MVDAKGEKVHQVLMAKKMQRLDESNDYRPFKFRIQAFTNAFGDEVSELQTKLITACSSGNHGRNHVC
jgi:DNA-binding ferritin-like protein (Dps family)